jgi:hypothetical protein
LTRTGATDPQQTNDISKSAPESGSSRRLIKGPLGVARGVLESRIDGAGLSFVMQTEGSGSAHVPVEFVARRVASGAPAGNR